FFFFQAEDGIRDFHVTGVQTCALPILPDGADSVVRQEDTDLGNATVTILRDRDAGVNIRLAGEDIRSGETVLRAGTALGPAELRSEERRVGKERRSRGAQQQGGARGSE